MLANIFSKISLFLVLVMDLPINKFSFFIVSWFFLGTAAVEAQEVDFLKNIVKESVKIDLTLDPMFMDLDMDTTSRYIKLNVNKKPLPKLGYNYKQNSLYLNHKDSLKFERELTISPYLTAAYTNMKEASLNSTETDGDLITNAVLVPLTSIGLLNIGALLDYMVRTGIIPYDDPLPKKESKKERALRIITKEMYPTEED